MDEEKTVESQEVVQEKEEVKEEIATTDLPEEVSLGLVLQEIRACREDTRACLDACKEIAKATGEVAATAEKWRKAGKFALSFCLIGSLLSSIA